MFDSVKVKAGITQVTRLSGRGIPGGVLAVGNEPAGNPWTGHPPGGNPWTGHPPGGNPWTGHPPGGALPVLPALGELLPGGLARGSVVAAGRWSLLCLALAAGASVAGAWCAVAGVPQLGVSAAAGVGLDPARLLLVADPGTAWPQVVASLLDGCELVLLRPPSRAPAQVRRRLEAVLRRCGGVLVVAGDWDGAQARLLVTRQEWAGIEAGHGRLRARRVLVVANGRGGAARPRTRWLWLPGPDGSVGLADRVGPADRMGPAERVGLADRIDLADQANPADQASPADELIAEMRDTG
jgi:hypothetical protein